MYVRPFKAEDVDLLYLQPAQADMQQAMTREYGEAMLAAPGESWTAFDDEGKILACLGVLNQHEGYAKAWVLMDQGVGPHKMVVLTKMVRRWLRFHNPGRIDTPVDCEFKAGVRWAKLLGFTPEGTMRKYCMGRDSFLYAQVA